MKPKLLIWINSRRCTGWKIGWSCRASKENSVVFGITAFLELTS